MHYWPKFIVIIIIMHIWIHTPKACKKQLVTIRTFVVIHSHSSLLIVPKKSTYGEKKFRMVVDYRHLNRKIVKNKFPLSRIEEVFDGLGRAMYISVLDMDSSFHQIKTHEKSPHVTSFSCDKGSFQWKVLPFGLYIRYM